MSSSSSTSSESSRETEKSYSLKLECHIANGRVKRFERLLRWRAFVKSLDVNAASPGRDTTLMHVAIEYNKSDLALLKIFVSGLIKLGYNPNNSQSRLPIPIFYCIDCGLYDVLEMLIKEFRFPYSAQRLPMACEGGIMHRVVMSDHCASLLPRLMRILPDAVQVLNERDRIEGSTPLIRYIKRWKVDLSNAPPIEFLTQHGAQILGTDFGGCTILHVFAKAIWPLSSPMWDQVARMIETEPNLALSLDSHQRTALFYCQSNDMVTFLLQSGLDPRARDADGRCAAFYVSFGSLKEMSKHPVDFNCVDKEGNSLLSYYFDMFLGGTVRWKTVRYLLMCPNIPADSVHGSQRMGLLAMLYCYGCVESELVTHLICVRMCDAYAKDDTGLNAISHLALRKFDNDYLNGNPFFDWFQFDREYGFQPNHKVRFDLLHTTLLYEQVHLIASITGRFGY